MSGYKCRTKLVKMHILGHFNIWNFLCIHENCESDSKSCLNKCVDTHKVYCIHRKKASLLTWFFVSLPTSCQLGIECRLLACILKALIGMETSQLWFKGYLGVWFKPNSLRKQGFIFSSKWAFMLVILTFGFDCYWRCLFGLETSGLVNLVLKETNLIWVRLAL